MKDEIKEILDKLKNHIEGISYANLTNNELRLLLDYITNLQEENERLKELYQRTYKHLFDIGNDELARYFQAQIGRCPTFTPQGENND